MLEHEPSNIPAHAALAELYMRDPAATAMAIEEHRQLLRLDPTRVDSLHALFSCGRAPAARQGLLRRGGAAASCARANEVEAVFYNEAKDRLPQETPEPLAAGGSGRLLLHPAARRPLLEVLRAIGDQLGEDVPAPVRACSGVDQKADKLKPDHAVFKAIRAVAQVFGVEEFEVYQAAAG